QRRCGDPRYMAAWRSARLRRRRHGRHQRPGPPVHGLRSSPAALRRRHSRRHRQHAGRRSRGADRRRRGSGRRAAVRRGLSRRRRLRRADRGPHRPADRNFRGARVMLDLLGYLAFFMTTALTFGLICLGLNLQWGQTGLFNVGVAGFVAVGAYVSAILTTPASADHLGGFGLPILVGWCAAAAVTGLAALVIGAVTLRLRSDYLAITTFGVAVAIQLVALNLQSVTGGPFGIAFIPRAFSGLQENALAFNLANFALVAAVTLLVFVGLE